MMKKTIIATLLLCGMAQTSQSHGYYLYDDKNPLANKAATQHTTDKNKSWYGRLDFDNQEELKNAKRGIIERTPNLVIRDASGQAVWNMSDYKFLLDEGQAPATVNPSLWMNALCNVQCGLFRVCEGIYQVRGYDMANMTFIKTDHGWIIFDVLMGKEVAHAAIELFKRNIDASPRIVAVLISHTHVDHYGGVGAIVNMQNIADARLPLDEQIASGKIAVITPAGFMKHVIAENAYCASSMQRRAAYQYGLRLPQGATGRIAMGIGMGQSANTGVTLMPPTYEVVRDETVKIDGLTVTFQLTPNTEAPAEMNAYFPDYRALWLAENCTGTMHNLYTLRGAAVRDAESWCKYILEAEVKFGDKTDVVFQSHNWPHWGKDVIKEYMENTAAIYKFIHDQTLYYINQGLTSTEIADTLQLPEKLNRVWYTRQYYGTLSHNIKAVYQRYMGWYDANPVNLNLLTPEATAKKWIKYMGGDTKRILDMAREDFAKGEYQWVAQVTKELVYADPACTEARRLCADALEQLGYQAESGTWRNAYLMGALELREGTPTSTKYLSGAGIANMLRAATIDMIFEYVAITVNAHEVENQDVTVNFIIGNQQCMVVRRNGVLLTYMNESSSNADATARGTKAALVACLTGDYSGLNVTGSQDAVVSLFSAIQEQPEFFNIIEP